MAVFEEDGTVSVTEHDKKIADLRSQLAASLKLQQDLAEENVRTRARLEDAETVIAAFVRACITGQSDFAFTALGGYKAMYPKEGK